jgi:hypothetical protein
MELGTKMRERTRPTLARGWPPDVQLAEKGNGAGNLREEDHRRQYPKQRVRMGTPLWEGFPAAV